MNPAAFRASAAVAGLLFCLAPTLDANAGANEFEPGLKTLAAGPVLEIVADPALIAAVRAQNAANAGLDDAAIQDLDQKWRAEVGGGSQPTIDPVLHGAVADYLRAKRDAAGGLFTEIFVMDDRGLNVAASDVTSDMWQGDEDKWQQTFTAGPGAIHISEVELDDSTQTYQAQVSVAITDPDTGGKAIGAATFGVNVELLP